MEINNKNNNNNNKDYNNEPDFGTLFWGILK